MMPFTTLPESYILTHLIAKKIPIEHILASTRGAGGRGGVTGGRPGASQPGDVNLEENANKARDACNC